jgi:hypothetical protein
MAIKRIANEEIEIAGAAKSVGKGGQKVSQQIYEGPITEKELGAAQKDPAAFLKRNKVSFPKDAEIQFESQRFGGQPVNMASAQKAAATAQRAWLCRITIIVIGRLVIIRVRCVPIIIIDGGGPMCW